MNLNIIHKINKGGVFINIKNNLEPNLENAKKPNKIIMPAIYPDDRYEKSKSAKPSDENVERSREWCQIIRL